MREFLIAGAAAVIIYPQQATAQTSMDANNEALCIVAAAKNLPSIAGTTLKIANISPSTRKNNNEYKFYDVSMSIDLAGRPVVWRQICSVTFEGIVRLF